MKSLFGFVTRWVIPVLGLVALSLIIWFIGPLLTTLVPAWRRWTLIVLLFGLWLSARLILWLLPGQLPLAWLAETLFIALLLYELSRRVWAVRQWRNMLFPPVLLALALFNSALYWYAADPALTTRLHYGAIWMITVLIVIIGGRVIPLFTGNRLGMKIAPLPVAISSTRAPAGKDAKNLRHPAAIGSR